MSKLARSLLPLLLLAAPAAAADWSMFKGDPQRSGRVEQTIDPASLQLLWQHRLPTTVVASPVAAGEQLFVAGENGNLYAFDLGERRLQWIHPTDGAISSTPAVAAGLVFVLGMDGRVRAIDTATGTLRWSFRTGGESRFAAWKYLGIDSADAPIRDPWDFFLSSPLVHDGRVYVGSSDHHLYALDAATGELQWAYATAGLIHASPAVAGDTVVIGDWHGVIHALDMETGTRRWTFATEQDLERSQWLGIQSSPVVDGERVYVGSRDSHLYALSLADGSLLWRYPMPERSWVVATPSHDADRVYLGSSMPGFVLAVDKHSGEEVWRTDVGVWSYSSPLLIGRHLVSATMKGELLVLDSETGAEVWRHVSDSAREDHFGVIDRSGGGFDHKRLAGRTLDQALYAYMQYILHLGGFLASPGWHDDRLIITTTDGQLLVFGAGPPGG